MGKLQFRKGASKSHPTDRPQALEQTSPDTEADLLRRLWNFHAQLRDVGEAEKVLPLAIRSAMDFFRVTHGCLTVVEPGHETAEVFYAVPADASWDRQLFADFLRGRKVTVPRDLMLARIRRYGRMWGALVASSPGADFQWSARQGFSSIGSLATQLIERIDEQRIREVRARIDQKILEQIGPKDLCYQILHGIRSLVGYDHSAALLTCDEDRSSLEVVGEQIAWCKAKSQKVGLKRPLAKPALDLLSQNVVLGFDRDDGGWRDWTLSEAKALADLLDYNRETFARPAATAEGAILCAPLVTKHGVVGVLKVAAVHPGTFGSYHAEIIKQFLPQVAVALRNIRRTESLEYRMRAAERKQAMADLARGVSHDVNNALGAVLPLVQELRAELDDGTFDAQVASDDLREIERSLQVCRRIFTGILRLARGATLNSSEIYLHHEVECTLAIHKEGLQRQGVEVFVDVPAELPPLVGVQADVEQLLLNLIGNARDAMPSGGRLSLRAVLSGARIELTVADNGCGIAAEDLAKLEEPFFTTKPSGNGLGLSICRSIVAQLRGKLSIDSHVGRGTVVRIVLPFFQEPPS
jgi:signal transduction histidine kinase